MKCPHCNKEIKNEVVISEAARIQGRLSKRKLTSEQAKEMVMKRWATKRGDGDKGN